MELRAGYQQTEFGPFPEDWSLHTLKELVEPDRGIRYGIVQPGKFDHTGRYMIRGQDYSEAKGWAQPDEVFRVSDEVESRYKSARVKSGDLIITIVGYCGHVEVIPDWLDGANLTQTTARIAINKRRVSAIFCRYMLQSPVGRMQVANNLKGAAQPGLNCGDVEKFVLPLPARRDEQFAIATALGDVDALLAAQDALISKKRAIKQGAMQELLTGKRRLPGFSREWEMKRLGKHLEFLNNGANSRAELTNDGRVRYLHYGDIHGANGVFLDPATTAMPFLPEEKATRLDRLRNGDLIFADASEDIDGVGRSVEIKDADGLEVVSGMHTIAVRFDKAILADGFKAYLQEIPAFHRHLRQLASGTKVYATNMSHIASAELPLPEVNEQFAISKVLSDMDTELTSLETQRAKTAQIKQGMMQELLTGRIRLV